jgi:hypothetical protein
VTEHFCSEGCPALLGGDGGSAVDVDDSAVAETGEVVNGQPDAGVVVTAYRVDGIADVVTEEADDGHLAGIARQVLIAEGRGDQDECFGAEIQQRLDDTRLGPAIGDGAQGYFVALGRGFGVGGVD